MGSMNRVTLIGNLGRDAEMRFTANGTPVATVSMATTEKWTDRDGQKKESTQWHRLVIWGKVAEALHEYLKKGKQVCAEGKVEYRKWTDRDGKERDTTEIRVDRVVLLGGGGDSDRSGSGQRSARRPAARQERQAGDEDMPSDAVPMDAPADEDIPF